MKISVIMPVYNAGKYLKPAIQSILRQNLKDFEFIIIDDGSTDKSARIIRGFHDQRIRFIQNKKKQGIVACLNKGIKLAQGQYIARMDADDISLKQRFEKQATFLDRHPEIAALSSWVKPINDYDRKKFHFPRNPDLIRCQLLFTPSLSHPASMLRKNTLRKIRGYRNSYPYAEDFDLWVRLSRKHQLTNLQEVLLNYRLNFKRLASKSRIIQQKSVKRLIKKQLKKLDLDPNQKEIKLHLDLAKGKAKLNPKFPVQANKWLKKIKTANQTKKIYAQPALEKVLSSYQQKARQLTVSPWRWSKIKAKELYKIIARNLGKKVK